MTETELRGGSVSESDCDNNLHLQNFMQIPDTQSVPDLTQTILDKDEKERTVENHYHYHYLAITKI